MNVAMKRFFLSGFMAWVVIATLSIAYFGFYGKNSLKFGIDLVGGSYITLEVQEADVIKTELHEKLKEFQAILENNNFVTVAKPTFDKKRLVFNFESKKIAQEVETLFRHEYRKLTYSVHDTDVIIEVSENYLHSLLSDAVDANINILERRLNGLSVAEIHISKQGNKFIVVELPDVHDLDQAKKMIGQSAIMEFKVVEDFAASREELMDKYDHELPDGTMIVVGSSRGGAGHKSYYLVP